jgi:hypothetical protein
MNQAAIMSRLDILITRVDQVKQAGVTRSFPPRHGWMDGFSGEQPPESRSTTMYDDVALDQLRSDTKAVAASLLPAGHPLHAECLRLDTLHAGTLLNKLRSLLRSLHENCADGLLVRHDPKQEDSVPRKIPLRIIAVASHVLAAYGTHTKIDRWLQLAETPAGVASGSNKEQKVRNALDALNTCASHRAIDALGVMLEDLMETDLASSAVPTWREKINQALTANGLRYAMGGQIMDATVAPTVTSIEQVIRSRNWPSLDKEYQRAFDGIAQDPPQAITASCAILESLCKIYIETERLEMPGTQTLQNLWPIVQKALGLDPGSKEDDDLKKILQGLASTAVGIAHLRTHTGSAHGRGLTAYRLEARHAHLAVGAAHTLAKFIIDTWDSRKQ